MKLETRYIVVKIKDANKYLDGKEADQLSIILDKIDQGRIDDKRGLMKCVVVEKDWPEYEDTLKTIAARVDGVPRYRAVIDD